MNDDSKKADAGEMDAGEMDANDRVTLAILKAEAVLGDAIRGKRSSVPRRRWLRKN
jgi:hypothetical protein